MSSDELLILILLFLLLNTKLLGKRMTFVDSDSLSNVVSGISVCCCGVGFSTMCTGIFVFFLLSIDYIFAPVSVVVVVPGDVTVSIVDWFSVFLDGLCYCFLSLLSLCT